MTVPFVVPFYAGIFVLIYIALAMRVARIRSAAATMIGTNGNPQLERAIRAHGNYGEYVPFVLLLLGWCEMQRTSIYALHLLCLLLLLGRLLHAWGISQTDERMAWRITGFMLTAIVAIIAAAILIYDFFRILPTT